MDMFEDIHTVHVRKPEIEQERLGRTTLQVGHGTGAVANMSYHIRFVAQVAGVDFSQRRTVLNDENPEFLIFH